MGILNFPEIIISDVNIIAENGGTLGDVYDYLYEYHGLSFDIDLYYDELNEAAPVPPSAPAPSTGSKVKDHFKKHWKKYAVGAVAAGAAGYAGNKLYHKNMANNASKSINNAVNTHNNSGKGGKLHIQHDKFADHIKKGKFFGSLRKDTSGGDMLKKLNQHASGTTWSQK